jgi:bifunctional DNA-binding transcriptional regulator/antitoxin component of YhaV-PrlF toxin-antitoxin module
MATNLTSKGQVTVPKRVRDYLGLFTAKPSH